MLGLATSIKESGEEIKNMAKVNEGSAYVI